MESSITGGEVLVASGEGICRITFSHPSHNAMPGAQLQRLTASISAAGQDPTIQVIILQSGGERTFCAGASFDELSAIGNLEQGQRFFMGFANVINACRTCPKPIIGRIQGKAVGGGVGIAAASDYCLATERADLRLSELAVGIGPFVVGPVIERKVGNAAFRQLALRPNDWFSASWGRENGLYQEVLPDIPALDAAVESLALELAASNPEALIALKAVFWEGTEHWDQLLAERAATSGRLVLSDFTRQALAAFKNR
jgi:methylglutaconyl-CoA hydratase